MLRALSDVAPEVDPATLRPDVDLRDQLDIDSMDLLNFLIGVHEQAAASTSPRPTARGCTTLDELVDYLGGRIAA